MINVDAATPAWQLGKLYLYWLCIRGVRVLAPGPGSGAGVDIAIAHLWDSECAAALGFAILLAVPRQVKSYRSRHPTIVRRSTCPGSTVETHQEP